MGGQKIVSDFSCVVLMLLIPEVVLAIYDMPIEILGWIIKPELSIGDIAAIVALILSPSQFSEPELHKSELLKSLKQILAQGIWI
jgi:hypothetical protein